MFLFTMATLPDERAEEIFTRTKAAFGSRAYPATIRYAVRISGLRDGIWGSTRTYDAFEEWPERTVFSHSISEEEAADPVDPPRFTFFNIPPKRGLELPGILGYPKLAVTYAFGLATSSHAFVASLPAAQLKTVGAVRVVARTYDVRLAGEEPIDGSECWHLTLSPLGNPGRYRLRDLWVDESSYQTRRLVTDGNFTSKETGSGKWTVTYRQQGEAWYLADEVSQKPIDDPTGHFEHVRLQFINVSADRYDNLSFGISSAAKDMELIEPPEPGGSPAS